MTHGIDDEVQCRNCANLYISDDQFKCKAIGYAKVDVDPYLTHICKKFQDYTENHPSGVISNQDSNVSLYDVMNTETEGSHDTMIENTQTTSDLIEYLESQLKDCKEMLADLINKRATAPQEYHFSEISDILAKVAQMQAAIEIMPTP